MESPSLVRASDFTYDGIHATVGQRVGDRIYPVRGLTFGGFCPLRRVRLAWGVFTGRYDALTFDLPDNAHENASSAS